MGVDQTANPLLSSALFGPWHGIETTLARPLTGSRAGRNGTSGLINTPTICNSEAAEDESWLTLVVDTVSLVSPVLPSFVSNPSVSVLTPPISGPAQT